MGKGHYLGGGTIFGPHTPGWMSKHDTTLNVVQMPLKSAASEVDVSSDTESTVTKGKLTRNQRRKHARARKILQNHSVVSAVRKPLSSLTEQRISKLKISISGLERQIRSLQQQLDSDRSALHRLLQDHGLLNN